MRRLARVNTSRRCTSLTNSVCLPFCQRRAQSTQAPARIIFSGIQPTGVPHLGNYLGALRQWVLLQNDSTTQASPDALFYSIVDLHSLTSRNQSTADRQTSKRTTLAALLACGLDPVRSTIFFQSAVPAHAELNWILASDASMGWLSRMTQWRAKLSDSDVASLLQPASDSTAAEALKLGLFAYPVLQAADILLYRATHVPVGEDQAQHIQFARNCAIAYNARFGGGGERGPDGRKRKGREILLAPETLISPARRVMSLSEPQRKMSKSHAQEGSRILLTDSPETITKKFRSALTDSLDGVSYDPEKRSGIANLLDIISCLEEADRTPEDLAAEFATLQTTGSVMKLLKERAAQVVIQHFNPIRERYESMMGERIGQTRLEDIAEIGRQKANTRAEETMREVREASGLEM